MGFRDLTKTEQDHVRAYLNYLHMRLGSWRRVERAVPLAHGTRIAITTGRVRITTTIAFRVAKALDVSLYDLIAGTATPPNVCPHCGNEIPSKVFPLAVPLASTSRTRRVWRRLR
jgi:hypothetical protein